MATFGILALTFGPCIAVIAWLLSKSKLTKEEQAKYRRQIRNERQFFSGPEIPVKKRAERIKAWLAYEKKMQEHARNNPDEFQ
jgi:hypothetical protein